MRVQDGVSGEGDGEGDDDCDSEGEGEGEASAPDDRGEHALLPFRSRLLDSLQQTILWGRKAS